MKAGGPRRFFQSLKAKRFWFDLLRDVALTLGLALAAVCLLYVYAGTWPPLVSVGGVSMEPHLMPDDLILIRSLDRAEVVTYAEADLSGGSNFGNYGDVIVYKPSGDGAATPVIHRAMYFVREGAPMWPGGPPAPHSGYVTQGDNNFLYDQSSAVSPGQPVKAEWILGVAEYRIPYLGAVRSLCP